jgi:phosphatidylserine decarboxylase
MRMSIREHAPSFIEFACDRVMESRFVTISVLGKRYHTPSAKRTVNPVYAPKDATFDFPIHPSLADRFGAIEMVIWDRKDVLRKEYLGEVALPLEEYFRTEAGDDVAELAWTSNLSMVRVLR